MLLTFTSESVDYAIGGVAELEQEFHKVHAGWLDVAPRSKTSGAEVYSSRN